MNPWMRWWLGTVNSSLEATRAFWAGMLGERTSEKRDRTSAETKTPTTEQPRTPALRASENPADEPAKAKTAYAKTDAPQVRSAATPRKPGAPAPDDPKTNSASETRRKTQRRREAKPEAAAAKRGQSERRKVRGSGARKAGDDEPKYSNPDDPSQKWSGRGRRPRWVTQALEAGRTLDDLRTGKR